MALLDTGATENFIDHTTVVKLRLGMKKLPYSCQAFNVDGTLNQHGTITHACDLLVTKGVIIHPIFRLDLRLVL